MPDLNDDDISYFKERLLAMRQELTALLEAGDDETGPVQLDQTSVGRLSRMDAMQRQAMAQETERRRHSDLRRIEAALKRIEEGEYGYCISSGDPIPRARLELDPAAATTVQRTE
ncbi:MAG: TraR/DksA family transcriptional regulator [Pseudomonadota bacterium]